MPSVHGGVHSETGATRRRSLLRSLLRPPSPLLNPADWPTLTLISIFRVERLAGPVLVIRRSGSVPPEERHCRNERHPTGREKQSGLGNLAATASSLELVHPTPRWPIRHVPWHATPLTSAQMGACLRARWETRISPGRSVPGLQPADCRASMSAEVASGADAGRASRKHPAPRGDDSSETQELSSQVFANARALAGQRVC